MTPIPIGDVPREVRVRLRDDPRTVRYGTNEVLYGYGEIEAFRAARSSVGLMRTLSKTVINTYGRDFAVANTLFYRANAPSKVGRQTQAWVPTLDVWETEDELVYALDLPGVPEDKITVELNEGALSISAERERSETVSDERFYRHERRFGTFSRTVGLPEGVTDADIRAEHTDGVLEIHVRKPEAPQPRRIKIGSGANATIEGSATPAS